MQRETVTKLSVRADFPCSVASTAYGANINCMAFNLDYIVKAEPQLAKELMALFEKCKKLRRPYGGNNNKENS